MHYVPVNVIFEGLIPTYNLNKKLVEVGHMGIKGASSLVNQLVD